jgi:DNA-binding transcriptional regulator YiaG
MGVMSNTISHLSGKRIRRARHQADMSPAALAHALGVPVGLVQRWETGDEPADVLILTAVSAVTGCSVDVLLEGTRASDKRLG